MILSLENATIQEFSYYWTVPFSHYKIKSIKVSSSTKIFYAKYNQDVMQYLESDRTDDTCPSIFSGDFRVLFFNLMPYFIVEDIQDIKIEIMECDILSKPI